MKLKLAKLIIRVLAFRQNFILFFKKHIGLDIKSRSFMIKMFISYFLIVITCIGAMGIFSYHLEEKKIEDWTIQSNNEILNQYKNSIDGFILRNIDLLSLIIMQNVAENPNMSFYLSNPAEDNVIGLLSMCTYLTKLRMTNPIVSSISIHFKSSDFLISSNNGVTYPNNELSLDEIDKDYINKLYNSNCVFNWYYDKKKMAIESNPVSKPVIIFVRKFPSPSGLFNSGGAIAITIDAEVLNKVIETSAPINFGSIFIANEEGVIISHNNNQYLLSNIYDLTDQSNVFNGSKKSGYFTTQIDGSMHVISYTTSQYNNWKYVTVKPMAQLIKGLNSFGNTIAIIALITFLFGLILAAISTRQFYSPLGRLADLCSGIVNAKASHQLNDEYYLIGSTLNMLTNTVKKQSAKMEENLPVVKDHFITALLNSSNSDINEITEKIEMFAIKFPYQYYAVLICKLGKLPIINLNIFEYVKLEIMDRMEKVFLENKIKCVFTENSDEIVSIINIIESDMNMSSALELLLKAIHIDLGFDMNISIGSVYDSITKVHLSYNDAKLCMKYSYIYPEIKIFTLNTVINWEVTQLPSGKALYDNLSNSLKMQDKKLCLETIHQIKQNIYDNNYSYKNAMKLISRSLNVIEDYVINYKIDLSGILEGDIQSDFNKIDNINYLEKWFEILINHIFACIDGKHSERSRDLVQCVKEYISKNIMNAELSLTSVSEAICISPTHLSHVFKDETGMNFVYFVSETKLDAAMEILLSGHHTIDKISSLIGYSSTQYFIKKFKTKYGMTPKEYKVKYFRK